MGKPITEVTIVGGGTAGWLSALLLQSVIAKRETGPDAMKITLIESPNVPTVGVGEATVPGMPRTLRMAGVSEREFAKRCNATFKLGVVFKDWNTDANGEYVDFLNPFAPVPFINGIEISQYFLKFGAGALDFTQLYTPHDDLIRAQKGPRPLGAKEYDPGVGFAYHLDAGAFAGMLRDVCVERGVRHIREDVVDVEQDERGYVAALQLKETGRHPVQLVIDCTGFRGVIINQILKEPFESYSRFLANDRAMAVQIPYKSAGKIPSGTISHALGAGWSWRVPLYHRVGTGYVFSSAHRTDEEAMDEFMAHLGAEAEGLEPRVIPMRIGRTRNSWVKNCVAVGLAGGFIEPLESTAIHMIDTAIRWLATYFPDQDYADPLRRRFNRNMTKLYDEIRDFIVTHYALGNRTDTAYWRDTREMELPDSVAENLELWRHALPGPYDLEFASFASYTVYHAVLLGKRVYDTGYGKPTLGERLPLRQQDWGRYLQQARGKIGQTVKGCADHRALLAELRGEAMSQGEPFAVLSGATPTVPVPGTSAPRPKLDLPTGEAAIL